MSAQPLRIAILGFGLHAIKRLVPAFAEAKDVQLIGLQRRNLETARANAAEFGIPYVFESRADLLASPEVDAVFITSPDAMHLDDCLACFAAGKAVLCEKPLSMNAAEAREILAAAKAAGVPFGIGQNFRYTRTVEWLREQVASGIIGQLQHAHAEYCYPAGNAARKWIADPSLATGGPIADVGVHLVDALRYILGSEPLSVTTLARKASREALVEAVANMQVVFGSDDRSTPQLYAAVSVSARGLYRTLLEFTGSEGILIAENALSIDTPITVVRRKSGEIAENIVMDNAGTFARMLDAFAAYVRGEDTFRGTPEDALQNMAAVDAAYKSWHSGQRETIDPNN